MFKTIKTALTNFAAKAVRNFPVRPLDSTRRARLKLMYLVPLSILSIPLIAVEAVLRGVVSSVRLYGRQFKAVWNHKPLSFDDLLTHFLYELFTDRASRRHF